MKQQIMYTFVNVQIIVNRNIKLNNNIYFMAYLTVPLLQSKPKSVF